MDDQGDISGATATVAYFVVLANDENYIFADVRVLADYYKFTGFFKIGKVMQLVPSRLFIRLYG